MIIFNNSVNYKIPTNHIKQSTVKRCIKGSRRVKYLKNVSPNNKDFLRALGFKV